MANITKEFLEQALGAEIASFQVSPGSNVGDNYASILYSIDVLLTNEESIRKHKNRHTLHLLLKCFPLNPARQDFLSTANVFTHEMRVYDTLIPELRTLIQGNERIQNSEHKRHFYRNFFAEFFYAKTVDYENLKEGEKKVCTDPLENCILMADIRKDGGFRLANRLVGFDIDHCRLVISTQAKLHALSHAYKLKTNTPRLREKFPFLGNAGMENMEPSVMEGMWTHNLNMMKAVVQASPLLSDQRKEQFVSSMDKFKDITYTVMSLYFGMTDPRNPTLTKDNVLRVPRPVVPDEEPWLVATHGDCWLNNMLFRYDEVTGRPLDIVLVDLQMSGECDPFTDVAYNFFTSTEADLRKEHADELLQLYTDTFVEVCEDFGVDPLPGFSLAEVKRRFLRAKIFGFSMASMALPIFLAEKKDITDQETIEGDDMKAVFEQFASMAGKMKDNSAYANRVIGLLTELYDEGIL